MTDQKIVMTDGSLESIQQINKLIDEGWFVDGRIATLSSNGYCKDIVLLKLLKDHENISFWENGFQCMIVGIGLGAITCFLAIVLFT